MGSLLEMMFVLLGSAILTVQAIKADVANTRATMLSLEGQNQATLVMAFDAWISDNFGTVLSQYTASGNVSTLTPPTIAQLVTAGNLKQAHKAGPFWGGSYATTMTMVPAGCTQAAGNCSVAFTMYPTNPLLKGGKPDVAGAAQVAEAGSKLAGTSQFGYSNSQNPSVIGGINGSFTAPNPLGAKAATVFATNGPGTDGGSVYIRRDGSLTWTGDQNVNGVSLHNVQSIDATGTIAAPTLAASNVAVSTAIRTPSTLYVQNAAGSAPGPLDAGAAAVHGNATVDGLVKVGNLAVPGTACSGTAMSANSDGSGQLLQCLYGTWLPIGGRILRMAYWQVVHGTVVPAPTCPNGGLPQIELTPQNFSVDPTTGVNFGPVAGTGPWTILIYDGAGAPIPGARGVVSTYCAY
ncbi:hypothetical protein G3N95_15230 [Paraburkholderia sp. Tr-20389]|uniref:hypothetical protein n=1 Tax=Paraburkholderia sp. Tr-20389 TaxID=2703903 RepID=UPI001981AEA3|nr:hypothetical protein [Paraburkholderia sp. Tr-20389]MBN3754304.1 hypothetical protein [Paraburkholderia sp. Tr-20389]